MDVRDIAIEDVVPHRGAMLFLHRLCYSDAERVVVEADIRADHVFSSDTGVPSWIGIEYMAQAIAAWAGCRALREGEPIRLGFLLGTRRYQCAQSQFAFGSLLRIEACREMLGHNGLGMFTCRIFADGEEIARANVSVFEPKDPTSMLEQQ